jgi:hypothetical protein
LKKNAHSILDPFFHETSNLDIALLNSKIDAVIRNLMSFAHSSDYCISDTEETGKVSVKKRIKPSSISSSPTSESTQISKMSENQSTKQSENQPSSDDQISSEYTHSAKRRIVKSESINMKNKPFQVVKSHAQLIYDSSFFAINPTYTSVFQITDTKNILGKCNFGKRNIGTDPRKFPLFLNSRILVTFRNFSSGH